MAPLDRHLSSSSIASSASTASATSTGTADSDALPHARSASEVQTRKRPSPAQLNALQSAFDDKPYLSRDERVALAGETGM